MTLNQRIEDNENSPEMETFTTVRKGPLIGSLAACLLSGLALGEVGHYKAIEPFLASNGFSETALQNIYLVSIGTAMTAGLAIWKTFFTPMFYQKYEIPKKREYISSFREENRK